ncbi:MAG TPA: NUDIX domain-containing protein [Acidimicrobiales bacterium]|jgi:predicted NUDIX family NTP pyrophosphohydrolase|nr:NUDIX domain-containing protein [Acidimicrobiales bacterium]
MAALSAGLLVFRRGTDGSPEVLLVHPGGPFWSRRDAGAWSIPKGEVEQGEALSEVAEREFIEELGRPAPSGPRTDLGEIVQSGGKRVRAWAVEGDFDPSGITSNLFEMEWPPRSGRRQSFPEVDRAAWFTLAVAREKLIPAQVELLARLPALGDPT